MKNATTLTFRSSLMIGASFICFAGNANSQTSAWLWAQYKGGTTDDCKSSISINASCNVYLTGDFKSPSAAFGKTTLVNADNTGNPPDLVIAKLDAAMTAEMECFRENTSIYVYPNPATDHLFISLSDNNDKVEVTITGVSGKIIYSATQTETQKIEVNIKDFAQGVYLVHIQSTGFSETKKLIIVK